MLGGFCGGLIVAWILSLFGIDQMIIEVFQPFVNTVQLSLSHYYIAFALIGLIGGAITR